MRTRPTSEFELKYWKKAQLVAGVDEAGRGAIAGPIVAAAVILPNGDYSSTNINDSKKLSEEEREAAYEDIIKIAIAVGVSMLDNERIDTINILEATMEAMNQAIDNLNPQPQHVLIDGNYFRHKTCTLPITTIIKGDTLSYSIAAASIIAKVTRDRWMSNVADKLYPKYFFATHKGYGTKKHYKAIEENGVCAYHRQTYLKRYFKGDTFFG